MNRILRLDPETYCAHEIHSGSRIWAETNCYVDVLIELIHALDHDPVAGMAFTLAVDFEVDQWTFFKYQHRDMLSMYGMHIEELNPWRELVEHVSEQVAAGRPVLVELDSFYLPDTVGSAYQQSHTKSTVAVVEIDVAARHMGYFHGQGYYHVGGPDFEHLFQCGGLVHDRMLPPYIELVKLRDVPPGETDLSEVYIEAAKFQAGLMPTKNPFHAFKDRFQDDLRWLAESSIEVFHGYSFATLRQYGANFELAATYLNWLDERFQLDLAPASRSFIDIAETAKLFQFKLARSVARGKVLSLEPLDKMSDAWEHASQHVRNKLCA